MRALKYLTLTVSGILLIGCSSGERYAIDQDVPPVTPISLNHIEDATPRKEPYSRGGNRDYTVRGKSYTIIKDPKGFKQKGKASWYGKKFHGHLTSNGETYDMYSMSAAHKRLPIPCYVKVTNLDNGKTTVVRVNDRGPFHEGRIIDLSYAAATKLDVIKTGVANVEIEFIDTSAMNPRVTRQPVATPYVVQIASLSRSDSAEKLASELNQSLGQPSFVDSNNKAQRVMIGPLPSRQAAEEALAIIRQNGHPGAFIKKHD